MKIHPLTYLYLFLAFISRSSYYVAFLLFSILHEIGHYLVALYFSFEIEKIMILPFGAFLLLKDLGKNRSRLALFSCIVEYSAFGLTQ